MKKCCLKKEIWEGVQFNFVDGIDGPETHKVAKSLGLSQNAGHSVIWEIETVSGWRTVNHGSWVLSANHDFCGEKIYTVVDKEEFDQTMYIWGDE